MMNRTYWTQSESSSSQWCVALYTNHSSKWWQRNQVTLMTGWSPLLSALQHAQVFNTYRRVLVKNLRVFGNDEKLTPFPVGAVGGREKCHRSGGEMYIYIYEPPLLQVEWVIAVVNAREWMEEPLLKASIDPFPAPEESKGLNVAQVFPGQTQRGWCVNFPQQGHALPIENSIVAEIAWLLA